MRLHNIDARNWLTGLLICLVSALTIPPAEAGILQPVVEVQRLGNAQIDPANNYSENTRLRIRLLYPPGHARAGQLITGLPGEVVVSEYVTQIYDGLYGATQLPMRLQAAEGEWEVVLKSLARYTVPDQRFAPVPRIEVGYADAMATVVVPQWVDADGNGQMDWLEYRVNDLIAAIRASGMREVVEVIEALEGWRESYRMECGGIAADNPYVARIAPSCINWDGENDHRLNSNQELTATLLHEARHVWQRRQDMMAPEALHEAILTRSAGNQGCERTENDCFTRYVMGDGQAHHLEEDAEAFANRYKGLFP